MRQESLMGSNEAARGSAAGLGVRVIEEEGRLEALPKVYGMRALEFESLVFHLASELVAGYRGGFWDFYETTDTEHGTGVFMAPRGEGELEMCSPNGWRARLSRVDAGLALCLFATSTLSFRWNRADTKACEAASQQFAALRALVSARHGAQDILALID